MGKGGGGGSTPRLLDDNLKNKQFLNVIDLVSEGPIEGPVGGMSGFLLNGTPVVDADGNPNIHGVEVQWRAGTQTQEPLEDFPFVEKEIPVNVEVKKSTPILRTISDQETDRVRFTLGVSALVSQDDKGNQYDATVEMLIEVNDGSGWTHAETAKITGKISGQYLESYIIDAPKKKPFQIRVSRLTDDSKSDLLKNGTVWASYTEITDAKFSYPNSAVVGMKIDKSQYGDTPNRTYHIKGMIIQVPDNYDPESRTYTGIWTGRFKPAWSNNPAWVFYDLVTNERYGIGEMIGSFGVDKFALYAIARYCDELVDDGFGNKEPRFTFNAYITSQRKAKEVIDDLASVFRGMPLWDGQQLTCFQDRPSDPVWTYTNSNVIDGKFKYTSTAKSARHNAIEVSWINPSNGWSEEREFIQDDDLIQRFGGVNVKKVTAFGCTSRGQAHRVGKWILQTEKLEKDSVTFSTGREGINCISGDIIEVADDSFAGVKVGGRVLSVNGSTITIDAPIDWEYDDKGTFSFLGSSGGFEKVDIQSIDGDIVTLREIPNGLKQYGVFSISKSTLTTRLFRVITISEDKDGIYLYNCIQHEPQKERIVDNGVDFTGNPPTQNVIRIPNIERLSIAYVNDSSQVQARAMWMTTTINRNISFNVTLYKDSKVVSTGNTTDLEYYFNGLEAGDYLVGVRGRDTNGMLGNESKVQMVIGTPSAPSSIIVESGFFEIKLIPHIAMPHTLNTEFEFWFSGERRIDNVNEIESKADFLGRAKFWTKGQLKAGRDYWFYVRSVNEYGKSHFVEAKGQADDNTEAILDELDGQFMTTEAGKQLDEKLNWNTESIAELTNATYSLSTDVLRYSANAQAGITQLQQLRVSDNEAWAQEIKRVYASIEDNDKAVRAEIKETQTSITELNKAFGQTTTEIRTELKTTNDATNKRIDDTNQKLGNTDKEVGRIRADVLTNKEAISETNKAMAKSEEQVQAQFGKQQGMINQKMQAEFSQTGDGVVTHSINITIVHNNVKYNAAGQVISAQVKNGKLESYIGYNANNFAWYNPVNGKMELFMAAKNGQLFIRDLFIEDGSITNAKIGNVIQSNNYVAGKLGWIINKNGFAEFQNIKARGEIEATSGKLENVIIEKNCEIKGTLKVENIEGDVVKFYSLGNGETITIPPQSFDRIIQVVIIATTHNSKWCRLWLNDDKFFEIKNGGNDRFFYYWNSPSTILKANTAGVFKYDSEDRYFQITVLACKK
ncbi:TipJ family phage tail tip protein [Proteus mirabilis]|uniref:TipJ family phage tail tip protein n=4 Tax=Proteus mirabilis TaxID=584 RepID=UPI001ED94A23|nr:phage tail protein [Proteus mirabilis]MDC5887252.1 phage tail protein [Proteus mirabilis]MDC5908396.1 phage tail protein [Proteus mirabilis]MDC5922503.1 phage tail protein [Proteus mirabilis]MDC5933029.1 phage tail protein [Proteus mirabilis]MDC5940177.1 phage tail protein [Proteus mirabilis]